MAQVCLALGRSPRGEHERDRNPGGDWSSPCAVRHSASESPERSGAPESSRPPQLIPLFPVGPYVPMSACGHLQPIKPGSLFYCVVCHRSGIKITPRSGAIRLPTRFPSPNLPHLPRRPKARLENSAGSESSRKPLDSGWMIAIARMRSARPALFNRPCRVDSSSTTFAFTTLISGLISCRSIDSTRCFRAGAPR